MSDYLAVKLLELEGLSDGLNPDLEEVRAARRLTRTLRDPHLAPLRRRHALFNLRDLEDRLRALRGMTQGSAA